MSAAKKETFFGFPFLLFSAIEWPEKSLNRDGFDYFNYNCITKPNYDKCIFYLPFEHIFFIAEPTSAVPSTAVSRMAVPSTAVPSTSVPRTAVPRTAVPRTAVPRTTAPRTAVPTTAVPTTAVF